MGCGAGAVAGVGVTVTAAVATGVAPATNVYVELTTRPLGWPVAVTPYWPAASVAGTVNVKVTWPLVSAVSVPTVGPLKVNVTVSPGLKLVPVTVIDVPGAACGGLNASGAVPWLIVKELGAVSPLGPPLARTPYWPGAELGTVDARLHV